MRNFIQQCVASRTEFELPTLLPPTVDFNYSYYGRKMQTNAKSSCWQKTFAVILKTYVSQCSSRKFVKNVAVDNTRDIITTHNIRGCIYFFSLRLHPTRRACVICARIGAQFK